MTSAFQQNEFGIRIVPDPSSQCEGAATPDYTLTSFYFHMNYSLSMKVGRGVQASRGYYEKLLRVSCQIKIEVWQTSIRLREIRIGVTQL